MFRPRGECVIKPPTSSSTAGTAPAVELHGITKRFPGVVANHDIDLTVRRGTVHALVGENGAGKSTLMKILYGMQRQDEGTIAVDGAQVSFGSPADAIECGIGMVHQHFMLADNLTVLENIVLGSEGLHGIGGAARRKITEISDAYGLGIRPDVLVEELGVADRQRIEILKVLYRGARTLILDEPTAVLVPQEVDALFDNLRELKAEGLTVLFISHKLGEVLDVADDITVIRRGTTVAAVKPEQTTPRELAELMVGSELPTPGHRGVDRHRHPDADRRGAAPGGHRPGRRGAHRARRGLLHHPPGRGPRRRRRGGQRAGRTGRGRHGHARSRTPAPSPWTAATSPGRPPASAARAASATSPRTGTGTACC